MYKTIKTKCGYYTIDCAKESRLDDLIDIVREEMGDEVADELTKYFTNAELNEYCSYLEKRIEQLEERW